jgi:hypothetical protein
MADMDIHAIYGVDGHDGEQVTDTSAAPQPEQILANQPPAGQTSGCSPSAQATEAIERLMNTREPITSAIQPVATTTTTPDVSAARKQKVGLLAGLFGGGKSRSDRQDADAEPDDETNKESGQSNPGIEHQSSGEKGHDGDADKSALLGRKHLWVGAAGIVMVVVCALALGALTGHSGESAPALNRATTATSEALPSGEQQRDRPISLTVDDPHCWSPSTDAANAVTGDPKKAWTCTRTFNSDGTRLTIRLAGGPYRISKVRLVPGWDFTGPDQIDQWFKYRTVTTVVWRFDGGSPIEQQFDGSRKQQTKAVSDVFASTVTLRVTKTVVPAASPPTNSAIPAPNPGFPGGWGSITLPTPSASPTPGISSGQSSAEPKAFAISSIEILGHRAQ